MANPHRPQANLPRSVPWVHHRRDSAPFDVETCAVLAVAKIRHGSHHIMYQKPLRLSRLARCFVVKVETSLLCVSLSADYWALEQRLG